MKVGHHLYVHVQRFHVGSIYFRHPAFFSSEEQNCETVYSSMQFFCQLGFPNTLETEIHVTDSFLLFSAHIPY